MHGDEEFVSGDAGYQGAQKREELKDTNVEWLIAERPGKVRVLKKHPRKNKTVINIEYLKANDLVSFGYDTSNKVSWIIRPLQLNMRRIIIDN